MKKKTCEFVIQGMEAGEWEIPQQTFTYFDVGSSQYKTLETAPIMVKILRPSTAKKYIPPPVDSLATALETAVACEDATLQLNTEGAWEEIPERKLPWWLFLVLFLAPIGIVISRMITRAFRRYSHWNAPRAQWRKAFKKARIQIHSAEKKNDFAALYRIFVQLFATRLSIPESAVSEQMIVKVLRSGGFSDDQLKSWDRFFADLSAFVFYAAQATDENKKLFDLANTWVDQLEEVI